MFYVFVNPESENDCFYVCDDDGKLTEYGSMAEAIEEAKGHASPSIVVKAVARVTQKTTHKVVTLK